MKPGQLATTPDGGRNWARRHIPLAPVCAECEVAPAVDRHHWNGDATDNDPRNILPLCRRCHMRIDGRSTAFAARFRRMQAEVVDRQRARTHCKHGHPLDYTSPDGKRSCSVCRQAANKRWRSSR